MNRYLKPKLINHNIYPENNGTLIPFYINNSFPKSFKLKRFFILYGKKNLFRADHAHRKCSQIIVPLKGNIVVKIISKKFKKKFILKAKSKKGLFIPPYNWITIYFKNTDDSLLTLCNYRYDKREYISNFKNFEKIILK